MLTIKLWDAIRTMRQISKKKGSFAFAFMSYSRTRRKSDGIVEVPNARLLPQAYPATKFSDSMLRYVDLDTGEEHRMWQATLMYFNGTKVIF